MNRILWNCLLVLACVYMPLGGNAQGFVSGGTEKFEWRLIGRAFFDGGVFLNDTADRGTGFQINDLRLGTVLRFAGKWDAKIELGYGDSKVSMKDIYVAYTEGAHNIRVGYYHEPFGYDRSGSANFKFMETAPADRIFGDSRKLGICYRYYRDYLTAYAGVFSAGDINKANQLDQGYTVSAKFVGRPWEDGDKLLHLAIAPRFSSGGNSVSFSGGVPTNLLSRGDNRLVSADVDKVLNQLKLEFEMIFLYGKWYAEGRYFSACVNRSGAEDYAADGWYLQGGYMILGSGQKYSPETGMMGNPDPKSLEILCRYDRVNLNDADAGIQGGKMGDLTVGANYYINKFLAAKLNYSYMMPTDHAPGGSYRFSLLQARLQLSF